MVEEQIVRAYNFLWGGHRGFGKNHFWPIINGIGVTQPNNGTSKLTPKSTPSRRPAPCAGEYPPSNVRISRRAYERYQPLSRKLLQNSFGDSGDNKHVERFGMCGNDWSSLFKPPRLVIRRTMMNGMWNILRC